MNIKKQIQFYKSSIFITLFLFLTVTPAMGIVYVDKDAAPGGNGTSWAQAYQTIQAAIAASGTGQEFWIAKGATSYMPSSPLTPLANSEFYGGFVGTETSRNQRNVTVNETIVDGQNTLKHVFVIGYGVTGVRIDGLTLKNGNANSASGWEQYGGGILIREHISGGGAVIANTTIENCYATTQGGGIMATNSNVSIENCTFINNQSNLGGGFMGWESEISITDSYFEMNTADIGSQPRGGAVWIGGGNWQYHTNSATIIDSTFDQNSAINTGGAVELAFVEDGEIRGCVFTNNSSGGSGQGGGGGIDITSNISSTSHYTLITECSFTNNTSDLEGGAIYSYYNHLDITDSVFVGNDAVNGGAIMLDYRNAADQTVLIDRSEFYGNTATTGGAIRSYARDTEVRNCVFAYNEANGAGAIGFHAGLSGPGHFNPNMVPVVINTSFYGNKAVNGYGGGILNSFLDRVYVRNSIFWGNDSSETIWDANQGKHVKTPDIFNASSSNVTLHYTDMESLNWARGSDTSGTDIETSCFAQDPLFNDPDGADNVTGTADDDLQLTLSSPCLDRADASFAPSQDIDYKNRIDIGSVANAGAGSPPYVDLGPYELGDKPDVSTGAPKLEENTATDEVAVYFNGMVNPNDSNATYCFEYGSDTNYGSFVSVTCDDSVGSGNSDVPVSKAIMANTNEVYHYRIRARNEVNPAPNTPSLGSDVMVRTTIYYVEQDGSCGDFGINYPARCKSTIQEAIDAAMANGNGGTIKIAGDPDSYGSFTIGPKAVIYFDSYNANFNGSASDPVILGN